MWAPAGAREQVAPRLSSAPLSHRLCLGVTSPNPCAFQFLHLQNGSNKSSHSNVS